ncbi:MAG: hypothetical protein CVV44_16285 [Spirochaetae bacterium HGW-Spirochaetae-1]|nr:MAG: hypothetical protein CVV44_16285 [Spirochaetae bacterium HGW-Spirochaetae-1]
MVLWRGQSPDRNMKSFLLYKAEDIMNKKHLFALISAIFFLANQVHAQTGKALPIKTDKAVKKEEKSVVKEKTAEAKKPGTGIYGMNIKLHVLGGGGLTYPGGNIAVEPGTSADSSVNGGFDAGLGASYLFLNDMVGINLLMKYSGKNLAVTYSGAGSGKYIYHTGFFDFALGVRGYFHAIYLYYEGGLSYGLKVGDWSRESPSGEESEAAWSSGTDLKNNLALYVGAGVSYGITPLISLEAGLVAELGLIPVISGPSPAGTFTDRDKLYTRYMGIRMGVTFSL